MNTVCIEPILSIKIQKIATLQSGNRIKPRIEAFLCRSIEAIVTLLGIGNCSLVFDFVYANFEFNTNTPMSNGRP